MDAKHDMLDPLSHTLAAMMQIAHIVLDAYSIASIYSLLAILMPKSIMSLYQAYRVDYTWDWHSKQMKNTQQQIIKPLHKRNHLCFAPHQMLCINNMLKACSFAIAKDPDGHSHSKCIELSSPHNQATRRQISVSPRLCKHSIINNRSS
jgi:hypothetical protein